MVVVLAGQVSAETPDIWTAAAKGNLDAVNQHLAAGTDVNAKDQKGNTPLDAANYDRKSERKAKLKIAELLREHSADRD